jgi:hypothetical protein
MVEHTPGAQAETPDIPIWTLPLAWAIALFQSDPRRV